MYIGIGTKIHGEGGAEEERLFSDGVLGGRCIRRALWLLVRWGVCFGDKGEDVRSWHLGAGIWSRRSVVVEKGAPKDSTVTVAEHR